MDLNFVFKSSDHLRYQNGAHVAGPHAGAGRVVKVEPNINGCEGYNVSSGDGFIVTVFNLDGDHPVWHNNVQMSAKPMRIVSQTADKIVLRGFTVQAQSPFGWVDFNGEDYGLTIKVKNGEVVNCILHLHDRNVDIEYLESENLQDSDESNSLKVEVSELEKLSFEELDKLSQKCADNRDLESLLTIAKWRFIKGSKATNESNLPEMFYYFGRLHRGEELRSFLKEKSFYLFMLSASCKVLGENLFNIGLRFPHLSEEEVSYLEQNYCDPKTFELFEIIMFDKELLPRRIEKFDKELLKRKNTEFSDQFLMSLFECFSKNEELDNGYSEMYIYSRISNKIIRKKYEDTGLGDYCIVLPTTSNQYWSIVEERFGTKCADDMIKELSFADNWEDFKKDDFYGLDTESIEQVANGYFRDQAKTDAIKILVAKRWLDEINSHEIELN
jgi:hypothetical protein